MFTIRQPATTERPDLTLKAGDRLPAVERVVGGDQELAGAAVRFEFWPEGGGPRRGGAGSIASVSERRVRYAWADGDTLVPGRYLAEFKLTVAGLTFTEPAEGHLLIEIIE